MNDKVIELEEERKDRVSYNLSFSEKEFDYMKQIEKEKKKNEINDLVISQLKKELEKCAIKLFELQDRGIINENGLIIEETRIKPIKENDVHPLQMTMSADKEDDDGWH